MNSAPKGCKIAIEVICQSGEFSHRELKNTVRLVAEIESVSRTHHSHPYSLN